MYAANVTYLITCITLVSIHTKRKRDTALNTQRTVIPRHVPWPGMTIFSVFVVSTDTGNHQPCICKLSEEYLQPLRVLADR